ncbi:MAG: ribbon-helix-helix domain-containing protein [Crenarchaeota archaeon]|nr:ribbon-helix-helix domain-containing protein [Thermoproteota archaeon]
MGSKYVTIKLPKTLVDEIDNFVGKYGFVSRSEVVKEAVRRLFQQYNLSREEQASGS